MKKAVIALENNIRRKISFRDIIIVTVLVAIAISAMLIPKLFPRSADRQAVILLDGEEVYRTALSGSDDYTFTVSQIKGMEFEINEEKIRVLNSDCHNKICVKTGFIERSGEVIVCLPKHVVVKIENNTGSNNDFDVVV